MTTEPHDPTAPPGPADDDDHHREPEPAFEPEIADVEDAVRHVVPGEAGPARSWATAAVTAAATAEALGGPAGARRPPPPAAEPVRPATPAGPGPTAARPGADPQEQLGPWLRRAAELTERFGDAELRARLGAIADRRADGFRVTVLGAGPPLASAVNAVLGQEVLPVRAPRPLPVPVCPSEDPRIEVVEPAAQGAVLALEPASWAGLPDDADVRVFVDSDPLRATDGELVVVDTDCCRTPVDAVCRASDVVLVVVNATSPLGLTERVMIADRVLAAHVGRVAVVVAQLAQIEPDERLPVLRYVVNRAAKLGPGLEVLTADGTAQDIGVETLASALPRLTASSVRPALRRAQVIGQLADHVAGLVPRAEAADGVARRTADDGAAARRAAELRIEECGLEWLGVRNEVQRRETRTVGLLRAALLDHRSDLAERLEFALQQSGDPQKWWREEFEYHLRRDVEGAVRRQERELAQRATEDAQWLDRRVNELFGRTVGVTPSPSTPLDLDEARPRASLGPDLTRYKLGFRIAPVLAAGIVGAFIGGPVAAAVTSAAAVAVGEVRLRDMLADQRQRLVVPLRSAVDDAVGRVTDELADRVRRSYEGVLDDVLRSERLWREGELAGLAPAAGPDPRWVELAADARTLHDEVSAAPARGGTAR